MAQQFEAKYRVKGNELTDEFFNSRLRDIDLRIADLEAQLGQFDEAVDTLIQRGLTQLNNELNATIAAINQQVADTEALVATIETSLISLQQAVDDIVNGGTLPASGITVAAISGLAASDVQAALAEHQGDIEALQAQFNGIGDVIVVADYTAAAALTGLDLGDVIHVLDNGSGKWVRYQVTAPNDGTWANATKVVIWTQDQAPSSHVHAIADITGLQAALDGKEPADASILKADDIGTSVQGYDADTLKGDATKALTAGYTAASYDAGSKSSGTFTPDPTLRNIQHFSNDGAFTLAPFAQHTSMVLDQINGASAGAITRSGFTKVTGDTLATTAGLKYRHFITVGQQGSHCHTQAMQ